MDDIKRINDMLDQYPLKIYNASSRTEDLREAWQLEEARKDYEEAKAFLESKSMGLTVGEAERRAIEKVYTTTQIVIKSESQFRRALADQMRCENEFTAVRKQANLLEMSHQNSGRV